MPDARCLKESLLDPAASCGAVIAAEGLCLAHLSDQQRSSFLESLDPHAGIDVSGVTFNASVLGELQAALTDDSGRSYLGPTNFSGATFTHEADFRDATFAHDAVFSDATFAQDALFSGATFTKSADFIGVTFTQHAYFLNVAFTQDADFSDSGILGRFWLGCLAGVLSFSWAELTGELVADVAAREVHAQRVRGSGSMTLRVRGSRVYLAGLTLRGLVTVQGLQTRLRGIDESGLVDPASEQVPIASIESLQETDAERLVLTDLDLSRCRFAGMHRLEQLRLEGQCTFATDPRGRRRTLAEEHHWRAVHASSRIGELISRAGHRAGSWTSAPDDVAVVSPDRLQILYRQLRVATEASKNEPGAAHFYYGEMEMRRHSKAASRPERIIVTLYWLVSGYGLRASRAITALAAVIGAATVIFATVGFAHTSATIYRPLPTTTKTSAPSYEESSVPGAEPGWGTAFYHAIDSSTSLLHTPGNEALTPAGRATEIALRLLGPVLLGLAALAIRGRIKR